MFVGRKAVVAAIALAIAASTAYFLYATQQKKEQQRRVAELLADTTTLLRKALTAPPPAEVVSRIDGNLKAAKAPRDRCSAPPLRTTSTARARSCASARRRAADARGRDEPPRAQPCTWRPPPAATPTGSASPPTSRSASSATTSSSTPRSRPLAPAVQPAGGAAAPRAAGRPPRCCSKTASGAPRASAREQACQARARRAGEGPPPRAAALGKVRKSRCSPGASGGCCSAGLWVVVAALQVVTILAFSPDEPEKALRPAAVRRRAAAPRLVPAGLGVVGAPLHFAGTAAASEVISFSSLRASASKRRMPSASLSVAIASSLCIQRKAFSSILSF